MCLGRTVGGTGWPRRFASRAASARDTFTSAEGRSFITAANWGVQPVNTRLSGFVCLVKRGALGPDSSSLCFTRNPFVCHFMRNPERWRCRGRAVAPVWVKRATSPSSRGSLGVHGVFPEQGLPDLAQCSFLADERDSSSLPKAP